MLFGLQFEIMSAHPGSRTVSSNDFISVNIGRLNTCRSTSGVNMQGSTSKMILLSFILPLLISTPSATAQAVYGRLFGSVTDPSDLLLPNARIVVTSVERGIRSETVTNRSGSYEIGPLLPGQYNIKVEALGLMGSEVTAVPVHVDQATRVDIHLQLARMSQSITVSARDVPLLKTDRAEVAVTFNERDILDVPLPAKGNFTSLELLAPGTSILGFQHASSENPQGGIQINVNGQNWGQTNYQLDGTDNRDPILGIIVINPNPEAVTETKITTQNFDAEFGGLAGVVSTQTKSGTNHVHGSLAPSYSGGGHAPVFVEAPGVHIPSDSLWSVATSMSGPLVKNRLFLFGDYAGDRISGGIFGVYNVPTLLVRQTCMDPTSLFCDLSQYPRQVFDPAGNTVPFANNHIPEARISPQAIALLKLLPAPNVRGADVRQNYLGTGYERLNNDRFDIRIDHIHNNKLQYFGRYSLADYRRHAAPAFGDLAGGIGMLDGFPGLSLSRNQSLATGFNYSFRDNLLADFRFGFFRYHVNVFPSSYGSTPAADAGISNINFDRTVTSGLPFMAVDGPDGTDFTFGTVCNCPLLETEQQLQWVTNWTRTYRNHTFKWGADVRYAQNLRIPSRPPRSGGLGFSQARTQGPDLAGGGLGLATFLLGDVTRFGRTVSSTIDAGERQKRWFFYGQDTWRISPRLTFNYGLRWDIYFPQSVTGTGKGGWLDINTGEISVAGYDNINLQGNVTNNLTNFAPRVGIAYAANAKTVVRIGYGRSMDLGVFGSNFGHTVTQNLPVLADQELSPATVTEEVFNLKAGPPPPQSVVIPPSGHFKLPDQVAAFALPRKVRLPTVDAWNVALQRAITPTLSLEAAYVANKGTHVFPGDGPIYDLNQPSIKGFGALNLFERRPFYKKFGWTQEIGYLGSDASNNYNSLQVKAEKRFSKGYQFLAHYTWSKAFRLQQ